MWFGADYSTDHYSDKEWNQTPLSSGIDADIQTLSNHFSVVRTYALNMWTTPVILNAAYRNGVSVVLEIPWVYGSSENDGNFAYFKFLFTQYTWLRDAVSMVIVGNENMPKTVADAKSLLSFRESVSGWIADNWAENPPQVGLSEQNGVWLGASGTPGHHVLSKLPAGTPVLSNIYPYWAGLTVEQAIDPSHDSSLAKQWSDLVSHSNKVNPSGVSLYIGETGWPTGGSACKGSPTTQKPVESDAVKYWNYVFNTWGPTSGCNGILAFSAYDEPFKRNTACPAATFPAHWGLWSSSKSPSSPGALKADTPVPSRTPTTNGGAGTPVNVVVTTGDDHSKLKELTVNVYYPSAPSTPVSFTYPQWQAEGGKPFQGYPFVVEGSRVELVYKGERACHATLKGGNGVGPADSLDLVWERQGETADSLAVTWANNGVWIGLPST